MSIRRLVYTFMLFSSMGTVSFAGVEEIVEFCRPLGEENLEFAALQANCSLDFKSITAIHTIHDDNRTFIWYKGNASCSWFRTREFKKMIQYVASDNICHE